MKKALLVAIAISALLISLMATTCSYPVRADSTDFIRFNDSGVTIFSPINITYNSRYLTLNLTLYSAGTMGSIDSGISMNYSIDGIFNGSVCIWWSITGMHVMTGGAGIVYLPELPEGSHCLTIYLEGLNQYSYEPRYQSYVNTVYFTIDDSNPTKQSTPTPSPSHFKPSPSPSPSSSPSHPSLSPSPSIPEFPSWIILPLFLAAILLTVISIKKKHMVPKKQVKRRCIRHNRLYIYSSQFPISS